MDFKIIWCTVGEYPRRNLFRNFSSLSPNDMRKNFIDVQGVYVTPSGRFQYLSNLEVSPGYIAYNVLGYDRFGNLSDYTISEKKISRFETSSGYSLFLLGEEW